jgi:NAD(P)H-quinone oxidoreductase subunit 5
LHDYHSLENAIGAHLPQSASAWTRSVPARWHVWLYRVSLERGHLDSLLDEYVVRPFVSLFRWCDSLERKWTDFLSQTESRESDRVTPDQASIPGARPAEETP